VVLELNILTLLKCVTQGDLDFSFLLGKFSLLGFKFSYSSLFCCFYSQILPNNLEVWEGVKVVAEAVMLM
jgi:hypothetical protein